MLRFRLALLVDLKCWIRLTDEVDDVGTPTENLGICKYGLGSTTGLPLARGTLHRQLRLSDHPTDTLFCQSCLSLLPCDGKKRRHPTQKPALDIHLDNNLKVTARVGRMSNGTDPPMTSPLRFCSSSLAGRATGSSDMFNSTALKRRAAQVSASQVKSAV